MPGALKLGVEVKGRNELLRKVKNVEAEVIAPHWKEGMEAIGELGEAFAIRAAPLGPTGRTIRLMYHRTQQKPLPMWTRVGTRAKAPAPKKRRGRKTGRWSYPYAYPRKLNFDERSPIKGWFDKAMNQTRAAAGKVLEVAAKKMEKAWRER